MVSILFLF